MAELTADALIDLLILSRRTVFKCFYERESGGLPPAQLGILLMLLENGPMQMSELAAKARTSRPNLTMLVERLHREELVERLSDERDRRVVRVAPTEKALKQYEISKKESAESVMATLDCLSREERAEMAEALASINRILYKLDTQIS